MNELWIVAAVAIAILVIAALVFLALRIRNQRRHVAAERIRESAREAATKVERREALADETAARARAAQAEAEAKAAEAARLQDRAQAHQAAAATSREALNEQWDQADRIDPSKRTARRQDGGEADTVAEIPADHPATGADRVANGVDQWSAPADQPPPRRAM